MKLQEINREEYQAGLRKARFKTFFHELGWQDILAREFGFKFRYFNYGGQLVLSLADLGQNKLFSLPFCEYGGPLPLIGSLEKGIDLTEFRKDLFEQFPKIKMRFHPQIADFGPSRFKAYWLETKGKSQERIFDSFRKTLRHEIKRAEANNLEIKVCQNKTELKKFYQLYVKTIKNKGNLILPFACFEYFPEILLAYHNNKLVAGSVFLKYNNFIHYYLNASDKKLNANHLILWQKIKSASRRTGDLIFDFGSDGGNPALAMFKSGWGTIAKDIPEIGFDQKQEKKSLTRQLWRFLPNSLAISLSKKLAKKVL